MGYTYDTCRRSDEISEISLKHTLKDANVLAQINKSSWRTLPNMTPRDAYSTAIYVHTVNLADIRHEEKE